MQGVIVQYFVEMGVDARLILAASSAAPDELVTLSEQDLYELNVLTREYSDGPWSIEPWRNGAVLTMTRIVPSLSDQHLTLFCRSGESGGYLIVAHDFGIPEGPSETTIDLLERGLSIIVDGHAFAISEGASFDDAQLVTISGDNLATYITVRLQQSPWDAIWSAETIEISFPYMGYLASLPAFSESRPVWLEQRDRELFALLNRNCL